MNSSMAVLADVLIGLGAVCILAGLLWQTYQGRKSRYRGRAEAMVVEIIADEPDRRGKERGIHDYFYPVFAFYADGRLIRQRYPFGSNPCRFRLNEKVKIRYRLSDPTVFVLDQRSAPERRAKALYYLGLALVAAGVIFLLFAGRK